MGLRAGLTLTITGNVFIMTALILSIYVINAIAKSPSPLAGLGLLAPALVWFIGIVLLPMGFMASRGVRSRALGSLFILASLAHLVFAVAIAATFLQALSPNAWLLLVGVPIAIAILLGLAATRRL